MKKLLLLAGFAVSACVPASGGQLANPAEIVGPVIVGHVPAFNGHQGLVDSGVFPVGGLEPIQITGDCAGGPVVSVINVTCTKTNGNPFGPGATAIFGTTAGTITQGNDSRVLGALQAGNNLSDVQSLATTQSNLGLGTAALVATGTSGHTLPFLDNNNTFSGTNLYTATNVFSVGQTFQGNDTFAGTETFSGTMIFSTLSGSSLLCTDASKHVTTTSCPGGGGGGGNVTGPVSSVNNHVAIFNGTSGTLLADSGIVLGTVADEASGTSGHTVPFLDGINSWSNDNSFVDILISHQITSTLTTGTAPFVIASTTNVANLNASFLNGNTFASPGSIGNGAPSTGAFTTLSATGQITSTLSTGTAPLVVASTTNVANLNASSLAGATFAAPGAIGGGTPGAGTFTGVNVTSLTASSLLCTDGSKNLTTSGCSGGGTGNVTGPVSSTVGDLVLFGNTLGTSVTDGGAPGTAAFINTGTSGSTIPLNNGNNTFSGTITLSALSANTVMCTNASKQIVSGGCAPGGGNVNGPVSTVATHVATWNNTSGTLLADSGVVLGTAASANTGTSGATVGLLNGSNTVSGNNTYSGTSTFSNTVNYSALTASATLCTDGSKNVTTTGCPGSTGFHTPSFTAGQFGTGATLAGTDARFFSITVGTGLVATTSTLNFSPSAANAIYCKVDDVTHNSTEIFITNQIGVGTTSSVVIGNVTNLAVATPWLAGDVLNISCDFR